VRLGPFGWKFPVTVEGAFMVKLSGFTVVVRAPLQFTKWYWAVGVAVTVTVDPAGIHGPAGFEVTVPLEVGLSWRVIWYSVCQFHVIVEFCVMEKVVEVDVPVAGTSPVPVHPVQT
jgi:hypothetical protein